MRIGNLSKAIAFASLWIYAAAATPSVASSFQSDGTTIWALTLVMSFVVIFLFDRGPKREE